jgi:hypothetical protein
MIAADFVRRERRFANGLQIVGLGFDYRRPSMARATAITEFPNLINRLQLRRLE